MHGGITHLSTIDRNNTIKETGLDHMAEARDLIEEAIDTLLDGFIAGEIDMNHYDRINTSLGDILGSLIDVIRIGSTK